MKLGIPLVALGLLCTGCGGGDAEQSSQNVTRIKAANPVSDQLKGMTEIYRYLGLRRAITDSGQRCKKVDRGAYQEDYKTMALWTAHCTDTGDWAIFIAPNADVQVRRCGHMEQLGLPACRVSPAPQS
ncbi:hypothetical protein E2493_11990 [Sphingomonas parva]|uniref:Uncharacterized protein n=1 Tax=Sphingomonas parva TaxID=2555898 RepID=A0A4Y8ZPG5_9SPHN|nr:hypothetical protein [Sphingomonas parva]TFI57911.1 hypothetical protein E2493_11990 [Sphingomonas parva]